MPPIVGNGVHLYTSELEPAVGEASPSPWLTAQAAWIPASQQLERSLSAALARSHLGVLSSRASVRPLDSLACPALLVELAPESSDPHSLSDAGYQERVAAALASALVFWQNQVQAPPRLTTTPSTPRPARHHAAASPAATAPEVQP